MNIIISTISSSKIIKLPAASTLAGRIITIKTLNNDYYSSFVRVSTTGLDTLEGFYQGNSTFYGIVSSANASLTLASDGISNWMVLGYKTGYLSTSYFNPSTATSATLRLWFDASDDLSITVSTNNTLGRWLNRATGNEYLVKSSNSVANATPNSTPALVGFETINGKNAIWFPVTSEMYLSRSVSLGLYRSYFAVVNPLTGLDNINASTMIIGNPKQQNETAAMMTYINASTNWEYTLYRNNAAGTIWTRYIATTISNNPIGTPFIISFVDTGNTGSNRITSNGYSLELNVNNGGNFNTGASITFINYGQFSTSFSLGEVLLYDGNLSIAERTKVEGYLAWKWGFRESLPGGHPYKFVTPLN